ncbi:indolepyruvate ferredoxin oxidoreductase family protein [Rhodovulum sp. DZ06]|uniref:indolepyruvate ferredoxin oxidoreductase family protein n=1 Tax=Rhodovulum sp. DZ06 TaxID=3425126 RepID=UPI003D354FFD
MAPLDANVSLTDKYKVSKGQALMTGMQALVRLALEQADWDKERGWNTGGYISGYRGSPVGGFDQELFRAKAELDARNVVFQPGLNEDLAATAISGSQMLGPDDDPTVEGVFSIWYGKGPGVDRSMDAIKHASLVGAAEKGGVLFLMGDDPVCKSSTTAHQSEPMLIGANVPVLFPASVHELIPLGLHGIAMSRHSGAPVGIKVVADAAESSATVSLDALRPDIQDPGPKPDCAIPINAGPGFMPFLAQEQRLHDRLRGVLDYARANKLNRETLAPTAPGKLGIIAAGKAHGDVMSGLERLGMTPQQAANSGIGVYKMSLVWPIEPEGLLEFCAKFDRVLVVEEKAPIIEDALARLLVNLPNRPLLAGKTDPTGAALLAKTGEFTPDAVAAAIACEASAAGAADLSAPPPPQLLGNAPALPRTPWYCSGCPHNRSTKVPEGSKAGGGIGCHGMSVMFDQETTEYFTQMGAEGMHWVGRYPFSGRRHMFQNIGDGTYTHSGMLAIRHAVFSKANITYKILYNDAVAMTGGQPLEDQPLPADMARQVLSLGVKKVVVVSDDPEGTKATGDWPSGPVSFHDRAEHMLVQTQLREEEGTTVLLYVQTCAAEKRRRRKRGKFPDPAKRVFINPEVCEGCGDCGLKSNCVSVKPLDTPFGTKRRIDQTSCNKDYSCVEGFCPSFVIIEGEEADPLLGKQKGVLNQAPDGLPAAPKADAEGWGAIITGIGGTGVITVGQVLAMAARLDGLHALGLDNTGLSQKNGAVSSHLQIGPKPLTGAPARIPRAGATALIACDMLTAAADDMLGLVNPKGSKAVANGRVEALPLFTRNPAARADTDALGGRLSAQLGSENVLLTDVTGLATALVGDGMGANMMLVGAACQFGALPLSPEAIEKAITLNGAAVEMNLAAFRWGRWIVADPAMVEEAAAIPAVERKAETYAEAVARWEDRLTAWGSSRWAKKFRQTLSLVEEAEEAYAPGKRELSRIAADSLGKVMSYKDEYEVARLHTDPAFKEALAKRFAPDAKISYSLAPPIMAKTDPLTGHPRKTQFGPWMEKAFGTLTKMKSLRGTPLDPFGRTEERKAERAAIGDMEEACRLVAKVLSAETEAECRELLALPQEVKGYGHVKERAMQAVAPRRDRLVSNLSARA